MEVGGKHGARGAFVSPQRITNRNNGIKRKLRDEPLAIYGPRREPLEVGVVELKRRTTVTCTPIINWNWYTISIT